MTVNYRRVVVTRDIHHADGRLMVQKGAVGLIVSEDQGLAWIRFDDGPAYVEPTGDGRRIQRVPLLFTRTEFQQIETADFRAQARQGSEQGLRMAIHNCRCAVRKDGLAGIGMLHLRRIATYRAELRRRSLPATTRLDAL